MAGALSVRRSFTAKSLIWLVPVVSTIVFFAFIVRLGMSLLSVPWLTGAIVPVDFAIQVVIAYALFCVSRRVWPFLAVQVLLMAFLYLGNALMIRFFEAPISPADVDSIAALLKMLPLWQIVVFGAPIVLMVGLFVWNLKLSVVRIGIFLGLLGVPSALIAAWPAGYVGFVDGLAKHDYAAWAQLQTYRDRGPILYFSEQAARAALAESPSPTRAKVVEALQSGPAAFSGSGAGATDKAERNVHFILVESFWNPAALSVAKLSRPPWPKGLEQLWAKTGYSRALSPAFGHLTANAEYEMLCGEPVLQTEVPLFVTRITQSLPCLPRFLAQHGYITIAQHPNMMNFWDRVRAYRYLGFERYYSKKDFKPTKLDGPYLSDSALFEQAATHVRKLADGRPFMNYIMTLAGHYPYHLNAKLHPDVVGTSKRYNGLVHAEVNSIHYTAKALLDYIRHLRRVDPTGLIIIAGDHLPTYGDEGGVYWKSGLFPRDPANSTPAEMKERLGTPLIVINGRQGPVKIGAIPMYEVAGRILDMLGYASPNIFDLFNAGGGLHVRPFDGMSLVVNDDGPSAVCHPGIDTRLCRKAHAWRKRASVLSADLLSGQQYTIRQVIGPNYSAREPKTDFAYIP